MPEYKTPQERLRDPRNRGDINNCQYAADIIDAKDRLIAELEDSNARLLDWDSVGQLEAKDERIAELKEALKPFASHYTDGERIVTATGKTMIIVGEIDCRRAKETLERE